MACPQAVDNRLVGRDDPAVELRRGQRSRPAVEQLYRIDPGFDLTREIIDRCRHDRIDQRAETRRFAIGHPPRRRLVAAALAVDHIGRHGPRTAGKAQKGRARRQLRLHPADGVVHPIETLEHWCQVLERSIGEPGRKVRAFTDTKFEMLAERMRHDEDIRKQDRPVEREAAKRLERHFGGRLGIIDKV